MTTGRSTLIPIQITPGVQPSTDKSAFATEHYTFSDKIRFRFGFPQKIGGWSSIIFNSSGTIFSSSSTILGYARSIFSCILSTAVEAVIGTSSQLYSLIGSQLTNITPLQTNTTAIGATLSTDYQLGFGNNPISTVSGSTVISFALSGIGSYYIPSDTITIAGATGFNGLLAGDINGARTVHTVSPNSFTIIAGATANATGSGGGASVTRTTGLITVTASNTVVQGERVKIAGAANTGGILAAAINGEYLVRQAFSTDFGFMTAGTPTSFVTGGGGAAVTYQRQIAAGNQNQSLGQGYGMGLYGTGLYGTARPAAGNAFSYPRIWFSDRFGTSIITTPGNQGGLYSWAGSTTIAPALISGAPTAINYAFVSDNIVVTFGAGGTVNRILASDQGNMTNWTSSSSNQVFDYTISGAGQLKSHVPVNGLNLIFTEHQTYIFQYIGLPLVWSIQLLENNIGIIGPMARCAAMGAAYWMDFNNFYMWSGGNVRVTPSNTQEQATILNYVYTNINRSQGSKCFAWFNEQFLEVWFHYPSEASNECDRIARYHVVDKTWVPDTMDRICAEYPNLTLGYPRLIDSAGVMYQHENGTDADGESMPWSLITNLRGGDASRNAIGAASTKNYMLTGVVPDSLQTGDITLEVIGQKFPNSANAMFDNSYTVSPDTELVTTQAGARLWKYALSGDELGQQFAAGQWQEYVQESSGQ